MSTGAPVPLAARLRQLRAERTQVDVAAGLDVSTALISSWEGGRAIPPRQRLERYAVFFGHAGLLDELMVLRLEAIAQRPVDTTRSETSLDVLQDIRRLLLEIRDKLNEES